MPWGKTQDGITISAEAIVVATNTPVNDWVKMHTKQAAYRTYVIGVRVPAQSIPKALYWDTEDPFHYVRLHRVDERANAHDLLIIGGEDHKTGQDEDIENRFARLTAWGRKHFPGVKEPEFRWRCMSVPQCAPTWDALFRGILLNVAGIVLVMVRASSPAGRF